MAYIEGNLKRYMQSFAGNMGLFYGRRRDSLLQSKISLIKNEIVLQPSTRFLPSIKLSSVRLPSFTAFPECVQINSQHMSQEVFAGGSVFACRGSKPS